MATIRSLPPLPTATLDTPSRTVHGIICAPWTGTR